jgi:hypothetical protein
VLVSRSLQIHPDKRQRPQMMRDKKKCFNIRVRQKKWNQKVKTF